MAPTIALYLALFAAQAVSPGTSQTSDHSSVQTSPKPNPDASGKYHIGDGVTPPKILKKVFAEYSVEAREQKISGVVIIGLTVDLQGNPTDVHVASSLADSLRPSLRSAALSLDQQALASVKQYKFAPATFQGKPVPVDIRIRVTFEVH
jgi:TonB family protein